jgi:hypothetical protein
VQKANARKAFNPLLYGRWVIYPAFFQSCPQQKTCQYKNLKKYVFLGKCVSYHLSLGDFFEKSLVHIALLAFLGLTQKTLLSFLL